jgi:alkaline phosphatase D
LNRAAFEQYLTNEISAAAGGYTLQTTLNETLSGDMGKTLQGIATTLGSTIPNPYTGTADAPPKQNPWIKYVETKTQGFITVKVTPAKVEAKFHHTATLAANPATDNVVVASKAKTVVINNGSTKLTIS